MQHLVRYLVGRADAWEDVWVVNPVGEEEERRKSCALVYVRLLY